VAFLGLALFLVITGTVCAQSPEAVKAFRAANAEVVRLDRQGKYTEGLKLALETLERAEKELGPEHHVTLASVNNLACLYESQGRYGDAEPLYKRALEVNERVLGPEHPDTL